MVFRTGWQPSRTVMPERRKTKTNKVSSDCTILPPWNEFPVGSIERGNPISIGLAEWKKQTGIRGESGSHKLLGSIPGGGSYRE